MKDDVAVIDIGSNSVRLLTICRGRQNTQLITTRLGQGVAQRMLQNEPIARTLLAIQEFCEKAYALGIEEIHAFATSAVRDARNAQKLLDPLRSKLGLHVDVLPGEVEAQLAYMGASHGLNCGVIDIGGASTELVVGEGAVEDAFSLNFGAVRLYESCGYDRAAACMLLDEGFAQVRDRFFARQKPLWKAVGGTATTLAAMERRITVYDEAALDGAALSAHSVRTWVDRLWDIPVEQRLFPGLEKRRADIIAHGALILDRFMSCFCLATVETCTTDNLMGYLVYLRKKT